MKHLIFILPMLFCSVCVTAQDVTMKNHFIEKVIDSMFAQSTVDTSANTVIVACRKDCRHYFMTIYLDTYSCFDTHGMGTAILNGTKVRFSGIQIPFLFSGKIKAKDFGMKADSLRYLNYDPHVWQIVFHKDGSLCKMLTNKQSVVPEKIDDITMIAEQEVNGSSIIKYDMKYVYDMFEAEYPAEFPDGSDSLDRILAAGIKIKGKHTDSKVPVIIGLIVDRDGKVRVHGFMEKSGNNRIDRTAKKAAKNIMSYRFLPAVHRGMTVRFLYPVTFYD